MADCAEAMAAFIGVAADRRLLGEDIGCLPDAERHHEPRIAARAHQRLVAAGTLLTAITLVAGVAMMLYGAGWLLLGGGGAFAVLLASVGLVLTATHWGWVHVAEYFGLTLDDRRERALEARRQEWLADLEPYPRYSVSTSVLEDASTRVVCVLHRPVLTPRGTFTFVREVSAQETCDPEASAALIATTVETMRRQARRQTDGLRELWRDAAAIYAAALASAHDERERLAARRAAALALSAHINASLLEPPLVE